jgi:pilus assembly protein TadC
MPRDRTIRIPFILLTLRRMDEIGRRMKGFGRVLNILRPSLGHELDSLGIRIKPENYCVGAFFSAFIYGLLAFSIALLPLVTGSQFTPVAALRVSAAIGIMFFIIFLMLHLLYPSIITKKIAIRSENDLLFALREVMLGMHSGIPLFETLKNVSLGDYGRISDDFAMVVKQIENGIPEKDALRALVLLSDSEYEKRAVWQMINALESGASMSTALPGIVDALEGHTYRKIRSYSATLNFLMLIYMLVAAAIPSLGITFLVLLSAFSGLGVTVETILMLIIGAGICQAIMIGYMSSTRPEIFGG